MLTEILVVDADPGSIRALAQALAGAPGLHLSAAVTTGHAALALLELQTPHVMLIDLNLPDVDGVEVIRTAARRHPACQSLAFMRQDDVQRVNASIEAGASGCLLKDTAPERIADAIHEVRAGGAPLCPRIARRIVRTLQGAPLATPAAAPATPATAESPLTLRECEVLRLAAKGLGFGTIGELLEISTHTVVAHVKKIYRKLSVHSRGEAVYEARQMGWL